MSTKEWLKSHMFDLLQTATSFGVILVILTGVAQFRVSIDQQRFEIVERFSEEWNSPRFGEIQREFLNHKSWTADSLTGNRVILCNFFDRLGMYESERIIRVEDVYRMLGNWPCRYWDLLEDAIAEYRNIHNPLAWDCFENLCEAIKKFEEK